MNREQAISALKAQETELRSSGLSALYLFGSVARGENGPDSDIDLACDIDETSKLDLFSFAAIMIRLEEQLSTRVDLVTLRAMRPFVKKCAMPDMVRIY